MSDDVNVSAVPCPMPKCAGELEIASRHYGSKKLYYVKCSACGLDRLMTEHYERPKAEADFNHLRALVTAKDRCAELEALLEKERNIAIKTLATTAVFCDDSVAHKKAAELLRKNGMGV